MIPFRDAAELEAGGTAAYLRLIPGRNKSERRGGLLQVNAKGEPVEFTFGTVQVPGGPLWRPRDAERGGMRNLTISLFRTSQRSPLLLLCLANEVPPELFRDDIQVVLPICRIAEGDDFAPHDSGEVEEPAAVPTIHLFWRPGSTTSGIARAAVGGLSRPARLAVGAIRQDSSRPAGSARGNCH